MIEHRLQAPAIREGHLGPRMGKAPAQDRLNKIIQSLF